MSGLRGALADYLSVRRALGFQLAGAGLLLEQFVDFADAAHTDTITTQLAVQWATLPSGASATWHAQRLSVVRCFARWAQAFDAAIEVPPVDLLPARTERATPYLYSDADVAALMAAAGRLRSPLAAATMQTFIGLVFATGLRRGEALGLDRGDFDPATGVLTIREAKFHKPRQLPVHPSTAAALTAYAARRDRLCPRPRTGALLVSTTGARLAATTVSQTFRTLLRQTGIGQHCPACRPRIHDAIADSRRALSHVAPRSGVVTETTRSEAVKPQRGLLSKVPEVMVCVGRGAVVDAYATDWPSALVGVEPDRSAARAADKPTAASIGSSLNSGCGHASMGLLPDTVGHVLAVRRR